MKEKASFGKSFVPAAVESCFSNSPGPLGITEEIFLSWLLQEPQTLVWLSTFFRLTTAEQVSHNVKCCVCKMNPILGLRYRCLYCFNYDQCQHCFFTGQVNRSHKLKHPIQEYCTEATAKENRKVLMRRIGNKLKLKKNKQAYLPITPTQTISEVEVLENHHAFKRDAQKVSKVLQTDIIPGEEFLNCTIINGIPVQVFLLSQQSELESVIAHLEQQHKMLKSELEQLQENSLSSGSDDGKSTSSRQSTRNRQDLFLDHDRQLELQLRRLRYILKSFKKMCKKSETVLGSTLTDNTSVRHTENLSNEHITSTPACTAAEIHPMPKSIRNGIMDALSPITVDAIDFTVPLQSMITTTEPSYIKIPSSNTDSCYITKESNDSSFTSIPTNDSQNTMQEMTNIQAELESIMQHLECSFPCNKYDEKADQGDLLKAAMDVGNILADLVDKVHVHDYKTVNQDGL